MGDHKDKSAFWKRKSAIKAEKWFDGVEDASPFDPFKDISEKERIGADIFSGIHRGIERKKGLTRKLHTYLKAAAVILLVSSFGFIFYRTSISASSGDPQTWIAVRSGAHVRKLTLPDKSVIYLNANTSVRYPKVFAEKLRTVDLLEGEAYFEVTHNKKKPFIVRSGALSTTVLGTHFNVEAYGNESAMKVSLVSGKVTVHNNNSSRMPDQVLTPGQMLSYNPKTRLTKKGAIAAVDVSAWINDGGLVFNDITLKDALNRTSRFYHVSILQELKPGLMEKHVTGSYNHQTIDEVLTAILLVHNLNYQRTGGVIYVKN